MGEVNSVTQREGDHSMGEVNSVTQREGDHSNGREYKTSVGGYGKLQLESPNYAWLTSLTYYHKARAYKKTFFANYFHRLSRK